MPKPTIPLSASALEKKKQELLTLLALKKEVMGRLIVAREMGDLSENGAYRAAKFELGGIGRRLREINHIISNAYVPVRDPSATASFGKKVTLKNENKTLTFTLVGEYEADPEEMKFSFESPLGKAVAGKKVGDSVVIRSPNGEVHYLLVEIV